MISIFIDHNRDEIRNFFKKQKIQTESVTDADENQITLLAQSSSFLTGPQNYFVFDFPKNADEAKFLKNDVILKSPHNFYFEALCTKSSVPKSLEKSLIIKSAKIAKRVFNNDVFNVSDAMFSGGPSDIWLSFIKIKNNVSPEELHGTFVWAVKTILMSKDPALRPTISPFVLKKIQGNLSKLPTNKIAKYYEDAVRLATSSHLGKTDFAKGLELLILKMPKA